MHHGGYESGLWMWVQGMDRGLTFELQQGGCVLKPHQPIATDMHLEPVGIFQKRLVTEMD